LLIRSNTENKRIAIQKHFPFDDHDEDVWTNEKIYLEQSSELNHERT
jgi:hypothetical protein